MEPNYRTRRGELDLILRDGATLVFVEVKLRSSPAFGDPLEAVTPRKQAAIRALAEQYLAERNLEPDDIRFDAIGILLDRGVPEVIHVENAF